MQRDRQAVVVDAPQLLEQQLGLAARVDEQQRRPVRLDRLVDLGDGVARRVAGPGHALARIEDGDVRLGAAVDRDQVGQRVAGTRVCATSQRAQLVGLGDRGRQADRLQPRRKRAQPRQAERQQVAALGGDQRMQLVEHDHSAATPKKRRGIADGEQQRQLLGRGQQDVGRIELLALPLVRRRVAGAGLDRIGRPISATGLPRLRCDVDGQRLQRRDVERVEAARARRLAPGS